MLFSSWSSGATVLLKSFFVLPTWAKIGSLMAWSSLLGAGLLGAGLFAWLDGAEVTANRQRFEQMNGTEKSELIRKWNRFKELPEDKQNKYREFHQQLEAEPNSESLREVLDRYSDWLLNVAPAQRVAFKEGELEQRIVAVRDEHIQQFLRTIGTDDQTRLLIEDAKTLLSWQRSLGRRFRPTPEDYDQLQLMLSQKPRVLMAQLAAGNLGAQESDTESRGDLRGQLVFNWLREIWTPLPSDHQLKDIYDTLNAEQKKELMELFQQNGSPNQIRQQLTRYYHESLGIDDFWNRGNRMRRIGSPTPDRDRPE